MCLHFPVITSNLTPSPTAPSLSLSLSHLSPDMLPVQAPVIGAPPNI